MGGDRGKLEGGDNRGGGKGKGVTNLLAVDKSLPAVACGR